MRAAHVSFQFDKSIVGGAEYYMYMLSNELIRKGLDIDIITTKNGNIVQNSPHVVTWKNDFKTIYEKQDLLNILRFRTIYIPTIIEKGLSYALIRRYNDESKLDKIDNLESIPNNQVNGVLGEGWCYLENLSTDLNAVRWTKREFEFLLFNEDIIKVGFFAYCPNQISGSILINNELVGEFKLIDKKWTEVKFSLKKLYGDKILCKIRLNSTFKHQNDNGKSGLLIKEIYCESKNKDKKKLDMEHDRDYLMKSYPNDFLFTDWYNKAIARPRIYDYIQMTAKGPISIDLVKFLESNAKNYDIILANMVPFNTINYAISAAKRAQVPIVLLPHFHINDKTHYWRYFFEAFKKADAVLVLTEMTKHLLEHVDIDAEVVGAGIDFHELNDPSISGKRFRSRYELENTFLVLFIGRKTPYKRYDMVINAINILRNKRFNVKLVMIGPDEDKRTIESEGTQYLGKVTRDVVLDALDACDVFAMPSENESFGIVFCEAWSRKKPVIANRRCGPVSCLIEHEKDGFLCNNANELAEYITILMDDPCMGKFMGENGYIKVMNNYTWDVVAERVKNIYKKLL